VCGRGLGGLGCGQKPRYRHLREERDRRLRHEGDARSCLCIRWHLFRSRLENGGDQRRSFRLYFLALLGNPLGLCFLVFAAPLPESISKRKVHLLPLHHDHCLLDSCGGVRKWGGAPGGVAPDTIPIFRSRLCTALMCVLPANAVSAPI